MITDTPIHTVKKCVREEGCTVIGFNDPESSNVEAVAKKSNCGCWHCEKEHLHLCKYHSKFIEEE